MSLRRSLAVEVAVTTAAMLVAVHLLYLAHGNSFVGPRISYIVAYLLLGIPVLVLWLRRRPLDFFDIGWGSIKRSAIVFAVAAAVIFPPFLIAAHGWQHIVMGKGAFVAAGFPDFANALLFQLLLVALPEEFYFRGYVQSAMNTIFARRWRFLGASVGWGLPVTAAIFAVAHTVVTYQWWHFAIFFPALVFGFLRERTGGIVAPTLFHAASNLLMNWFARSYI
ncbi:MAG: JDVT-CTERM system glutamic-type intramembrane protease [bacterium]